MPPPPPSAADADAAALPSDAPILETNIAVPNELNDAPWYHIGL